VTSTTTPLQARIESFLRIIRVFICLIFNICT